MTDPLIRFIEFVCVQTAVYWGNPQPDGYGGTDYDAPVEIDCRWDGKTKLVTDNNGKEVVSSATILVTQDLDIDGVLYLGALSDIDSDNYDSPEQVDGVRSIITKQTTPLFMSSTEFVYEVFV